MPSWKIHRYWGARLGLGQELMKQIDSEIDAHSSHDFILRGAWNWLRGYDAFLAQHGREGLAYMLLHGALDLISRSLEKLDLDEIWFRVRSWILAKGTSRIIRRVWESYLGDRISAEAQLAELEERLWKLDPGYHAIAEELLEFLEHHLAQIHSQLLGFNRRKLKQGRSNEIKSKLDEN